MINKYVYKKTILRMLFSLIDAVGYPLAKVFRKDREFVPEKILLIRGDHIGDVVASTSVVKPLKEKFPHSRIDFIAPGWAYDILENNPNIDNVISLSPPWFDRASSGFGPWIKGFREMIRTIKNGKYNVAIDLRGDFRHIAAMAFAGVPKRISYGITGGGFLLTDEVPYEGKVHEKKRNLDLLGPLGVVAEEGKVELYVSEKDGEEAERLIEESGVIGGFALIHPIPGHSSKVWQENKFGTLIEHMFSKGITPVLVGGSSDRSELEGLNAPGVVNLSGETSIRSLAALCKRAKLFVGVDSGPAHIAAGSGTPSVILFSGTNSPEEWAPEGSNVKVVCPGEGKDLSYVSAEEVCSVVDEIIEKGKRKKEKGKNIGTF